MLSCPNKSTKQWKYMVSKLGENQAYFQYAKNKFDLLEENDVNNLLNIITEEPIINNEEILNKLLEPYINPETYLELTFNENDPIFNNVFKLKYSDLINDIVEFKLKESPELKEYLKDLNESKLESLNKVVDQIIEETVSDQSESITDTIENNLDINNTDQLINAAKILNDFPSNKVKLINYILNEVNSDQYYISNLSNDKKKIIDLKSKLPLINDQQVLNSLKCK